MVKSIVGVNLENISELSLLHTHLLKTVVISFVLLGIYPFLESMYATIRNSISFLSHFLYLTADYRGDLFYSFIYLFVTLLLSILLQHLMYSFILFMLRQVLILIYRKETNYCLFAKIISHFLLISVFFHATVNSRLETFGNTQFLGELFTKSRRIVPVFVVLHGDIYHRRIDDPYRKGTHKL